MNAKKRRIWPPDKPLLELLACRVCLVTTNCKLYSLRKENLKSIYSRFTSSILDSQDGLPHYICSYCRALLMKAVAFKNKCVATEIHLQNYRIYQPITMEYLRNLDNTDFKNSYKETQVLNIDLPGNVLNVVESEIKLEPELENDSNENIYIEINEIKNETDDLLDLENDNVINHNVIMNPYNFKAEEYHIVSVEKNSDTDGRKDLIMYTETNDVDQRLNNDLQNINTELENKITENIDFDKYDINNFLNFKNNNVNNDTLTMNPYNSQAEEYILIDDDSVEKNNDTDCSEDVIMCTGMNDVDNQRLNNDIQSLNRHCDQDFVNINSQQQSTAVDFKKKVTKSKCKKYDSDKIKVILEKRLKKKKANKMLYKFILEKYIEKSMDCKDVINIVSDEDLVGDGDKCHFAIKDNPDINTENLADASKIKFYTYIRNCYNIEIPQPKLLVPYKFEDAENNYKWRIKDAGKQYNFSLKVLSFEEQKQEMIRHTAKFRNCLFKCKLCSRGYQDESSYNRHMKAIHDPSFGTESCEVCGKRCRDARRLLRHTLLHKYVLACNECGHKCNNKGLAMVHFKSHQGHKFPCKHCGKIFTKDKSRSNHVRLNHMHVPCPVCYRRLANDRALALHNRLMHRTTFPCGECKRVFATEDALRTHTNAASAGCSDLICCTICGDSFEYESDRQYHVASAHPEIKSYKKYRSCCPCRCVNKTKTNNSSDTNSIDRNKPNFDGTGENKSASNTIYEGNNINLPENNENILLVVKDANINTTDRNDVDNIPKDANMNTNDRNDIDNIPKDANMNTNDRNDIDNIPKDANMNTNNRNDIDNIPKDANMNTNNKNDIDNIPNTFKTTTFRGGRPRKFIRECDCDCVAKGQKSEYNKTLMCETCGKTGFGNNYFLKEHQLVHTGEKPFACDHCDKRFRTKSNLVIHMPVHTGLRNYPCPVCAKKFKSAWAVNRHKKTVHLKLRSHRCNLCGNTQLTSTGLNMHFRTVHLKMPYPPRRRRTRKKKIKHTGEL